MGSDGALLREKCAKGGDYRRSMEVDQYCILSTEREEGRFGFVPYVREVCTWDGSPVPPATPLVQILSLMRSMDCSFVVEHWRDLDKEDKKQLCIAKNQDGGDIQRRVCQLSFFHVQGQSPGFLPEGAEAGHAGIGAYREEAFKRADDDRNGFVSLVKDRGQDVECLGYARLCLDRVEKGDKLKLRSLISEAVIREPEPASMGLPGLRAEADEGKQGSTGGTQKEGAPICRYVHSKAEYPVEVFNGRFAVVGSYFVQADGIVTCCGHVATLMAARNLAEALTNTTYKKPIVSELTPSKLYQECSGTQHRIQSGLLRGVSHPQMATMLSVAKIEETLDIGSEPFEPVTSRALDELVAARSDYLAQVAESDKALDRLRDAEKKMAELDKQAPAHLDAAIDKCWSTHLSAQADEDYRRAYRRDSSAVEAYTSVIHGQGETITELVYHAVEAGLPVILSFKGREAWHSMTVVGHTFEAGLWSARADAAYLTSGRTGVMRSDQWVNGFIVMDGNFGPYRILSRRFLQDRLLKVLVPRFPWARSLERVEGCGLGAASINTDLGARARTAVQAQATAQRLLLQPPLSARDRDDLDRELCIKAGHKIPLAPEWNFLDYIKVRCEWLRSESEDTFWFEQLRDHLRGGTCVLRTVPCTAEKYVSQLSSPEEGLPILEGDASALKTVLGAPPFWLVELSIPELYEWNNRRLGEIVIAENQTHPDDMHVLLVRLPSVIYLWNRERKTYLRGQISGSYHYPISKTVPGEAAELLFSPR